MKFGCCVKKLNHLDAIEELGFDYIEASVRDILIPLQDDKKWEVYKSTLNKLTIPIEAANSLIDSKIVGNDVDYNVIDQYLERAFSRAKSIGVKIVGFGSGYSRTVPENYSQDKAYNQLIKFLKMAIEYAEINNIIIGLEPLNRKETNFINSIDEAWQIINKLNNPNLKLLVDFYHINEEEDNLKILREVKRELAHIHIADTLRKCPGSGNYDFRSLFSVLNEIHYNSTISFECESSDFLELGHSLQYVQNLLN